MLPLLPRIALRAICAGNPALYSALADLYSRTRDEATLRRTAARHGVDPATLMRHRDRFALILDEIAEAEGMTRGDLMKGPR